jgi:hypothetical protein
VIPLSALRVHQPRFGFGCSSGTFAPNLLLLLLIPSLLSAQIDYRNLEDGRPAFTEDAYSLERYAFDLLAPYRFEADAGGGELHLVVPEVAYGIARNTQVGLKLPVAAVVRTGTEWGVGGVRVFGLHNFNTESPSLPALSVRADVGFPVGSLAGEDLRMSLKAIATRSWGRTRAHLNAARGFGSEDALALAEPIPRWSASLAIDRTFFRPGLLLVAELATAQSVGGARATVNASVGARWQWTPTLVLDAGATRRLRTGIGPDIGLTLGLSHAFAVRGLMPAASP